MIQTETINERLVRHYSDAGLRIEQVETGSVYDDAIDLIPCAYTYRETAEPVAAGGGNELEELRTQLEDAETAAKIFLGEAE